jgi:hypothetical protein
LLPKLARTPNPQIDGAHELLRNIADAAQRDKDPELEKLAEQISDLLRKFEQDEITRKELFEKLAELEQKYMALEQGDFDAQMEKLRKAGEALAKEKPTKEVGQALGKDDLARAKQKMEELAKKTAEQKLSQKEAKDAERALADAAAQMKRQLEDEQKKMDAQSRALEEQKRELDRLSRDEQPKSEAEKRRLEDQKRELDRLSRENQRERDKSAQNKRQLERLSRNMSDAAQKMNAQNPQGASQSMKDSAQQMGRMADEMRRAGDGQRVRVQLADLKEMIRRAGNGKDGQKQGQGQGKDGQGQKGGKMGDFMARAGGKQGDGKSDQQMFMEGEGQQGGPKLLLPGVGQRGSSKMQMEMEGQGQGQGQDSPSGKPGDGIGNEHDPNLTGDATKLASKKRDVFDPGQQGAGPTRSEVIYGAAGKGFAERSYKRVYSDYTQVVEEVMGREQVPLGMRYYVKRYFNLIKPRE